MSQAQQQPDAALVDALRKKLNDLDERVETLEAENKDLRAKIEVLEDRAPAPGEQEYEAMDKHDKATVVRSKMKETAKATNGKAKMEYKDVIAVFDGRASPGHAYDIMDVAGDGDGFDYGTAPDGTKRLTYAV
jgi:predicted  nucleic acid-binding Zn-ribbon protein